jgi:hypothetical protein
LGFLARLVEALGNDSIDGWVVLLDAIYEEICHFYRGQFPFANVTGKLFRRLIQHMPFPRSNSFYWTLEDSAITLAGETAR